MNHNEIRLLPAYAALLAIGAEEITNARQEQNGTMSFLTIKGKMTIHRNGYVRRAWVGFFGGIHQAPIVMPKKDVPSTITTADEWTKALNRIVSVVTFSHAGRRLNVNPIEVVRAAFVLGQVRHAQLERRRKAYKKAEAGGPAALDAYYDKLHADFKASIASK